MFGFGVCRYLGNCDFVNMLTLKNCLAWIIVGDYNTIRILLRNPMQKSQELFYQRRKFTAPVARLVADSSRILLVINQHKNVAFGWNFSKVSDSIFRFVNQGKLLTWQGKALIWFWMHRKHMIKYYEQQVYSSN